jgi:electron transfer flavoprotein alpha subunit
LSGSPTWVEAIYSIEPKRRRIMLDGDVHEAARKLMDCLHEEGFGGHEWKSRPHQHVRAAERKPHARGARSIWVVAEAVGEVSPRNHDHSGQSLREITLELMGAGIRLADQIEGELAAVLLGHKPNELVNLLAANGADKVYVADSPLLARYSTEPFTSVLCEAIRQYQPFAVLFGATADGRDLAPRVAARLGLGLTGDAIGVEIDEQGRVVMLKPAFGGNIVAPILSRTSPALVTVRSGMLQKPEPDPERRTILMRLPVYPMPVRTRVLSQQIITEEGLELDGAEIVIGVGTGVGGPDNLPAVHALAQKMHAHLAATRKVVDYGWMPPQTQVGLTGRAIAPRVYLMLGISGQFNHMVGVQRSGTIVAVCDNPEAPIFKQCDYGIVADWRQFADAFGQVVA